MAVTAELIKEVLTAPFGQPKVLWLLIPLFLYWFFAELYFGKHKREKIGWNTALANGLTIFWISLSVFREIGWNNTSIRHYALGGFALYGLLVAFTSFKHALADKLEFLVASPTVTFFLSSLAVVIGYGVVRLTIDTALIFGGLFVAILVVTKTTQQFLHESY